MKKSLIVLAVILVVPLFLISSASALYFGITDGYITNMTGGYVSGASVTVTVSGCSGGSGNGCSGSATSGANGYYVVNNLNLPKTGSASVGATKAVGGSGSNSGTADDYVAHVDVTICYAPSSPVLTPVSNSHYNNVTFSWTSSGMDSHGFTLHDKFTLDSLPTVNPAFSPIDKNASFATHSWIVSSCNSMCCGSSSDSFTIWNNAPSAPTNANSSFSGNITSLNWTSGIDPDIGDTTYDQFKYSNGTIVNTTSPYNIPAELLIKWSVRTCDNFDACSSWVSVDSVSCGNATGTCTTATCPVCEECPGGGGGGGGGGAAHRTNVSCNGRLISEDVLSSIDMKMGLGTNKITINGKNMTFKNMEYCPWCYNGKKDFDEEGTDCGGSCKKCPKSIEAELGLPVKAGIPWVWIILITITVAFAIVIYLSYQFDWAKKLSKFLKKR